MTPEEAFEKWSWDVGQDDFVRVDALAGWQAALRYVLEEAEKMVTGCDYPHDGVPMVCMEDLREICGKVE